jgi:hypothetical protein
MAQLLLKRASASRPSGQWNEDDFDVLVHGSVVSRIFKANAAPIGSPWMWTLTRSRLIERALDRRQHGYPDYLASARSQLAHDNVEPLWAPNQRQR